MDLIRKILGFREFLSLEAVKDDLVSRGLVDNETRQHLKHLILFRTNAQITWLIATKDKVFCFLDDARKDGLDLRWVDQIANINNQVKLDWDYKDNVAIVDFSQNHKRWLITKKDFESQVDFMNSLKNLLNNDNRS